MDQDLEGSGVQPSFISYLRKVAMDLNKTLSLLLGAVSSISG